MKFGRKALASVASREDVILVVVARVRFEGRRRRYRQYNMRRTIKRTIPPAMPPTMAGIWEGAEADVIRIGGEVAVGDAELDFE